MDKKNYYWVDDHPLSYVNNGSLDSRPWFSGAHLADIIIRVANSKVQSHRVWTAAWDDPRTSTLQCHYGCATCVHTNQQRRSPMTMTSPTTRIDKQQTIIHKLQTWHTRHNKQESNKQKATKWHQLVYLWQLHWLVLVVAMVGCWFLMMLLLLVAVYYFSVYCFLFIVFCLLISVWWLLLFCLLFRVCCLGVA